MIALYKANQYHIYIQLDRGAQSWNSIVFEITDTEKTVIASVDDVKSENKPDIKIQIVKNIPKDTSKTAGLLLSLPLAVGLQYDLAANIDTSDGLTNEASCLLNHIDYRQQHILGTV